MRVVREPNNGSTGIFGEEVITLGPRAINKISDRKSSGSGTAHKQKMTKGAHILNSISIPLPNHTHN